MVTAIQNKNETTITISKKVSKAELQKILNYINHRAVKPKKDLTKEKQNELADEIALGIRNRFAKERGLIMFCQS